MTKTICIYHAHCVDGFTAAWCVREALGDGVEFIPASYQTPPPDVTGADVIIVDFSYKRDVLTKMASSARSILILDHHVTAQEDLAGLRNPARGWQAFQQQLTAEIEHGFEPNWPRAEFDMTRSGAQMAWDFFCANDQDDQRPAMIDYVADRDLWKWEMEQSREVSAVLASHEHDWNTWSDLAERMSWRLDLEQLFTEGAAILRKIEKDVTALIGSSKRSMVIGGHNVPAVNAPPFLASETAGRMAQDAPFAATYYDGPNGRAFSLRSRGEAGMDVSAIASSYGGGGHRNAAGFLITHGWEGDT